jgi:hypothetical protein
LVARRPGMLGACPPCPVIPSIGQFVQDEQTPFEALHREA